MSGSGSPTPDKPTTEFSNENEFSNYRQASDIVITVDTGNSVCSTILVEGCSDDLDLSLNDDAASCEKSSEAGEEQNDPPITRRTRSKTASARAAKRSSPKKTRKGRKTRSSPQPQSESRKGFSSYLRSAVLSRDEINREVLHHSKADVPKPREASLFTTKLMMRLASRLPPSRARPTCEELKEMMNANRDGEMDYQSIRNIGQGTPLRVKAEKPSFCETINHIMQPHPLEDPATFEQEFFFNITCSNIHCREEREQKIAMYQEQSVDQVDDEDEVETQSAYDDPTIASLQEAMRNSNCPNRKEIEKQIALHQLESLRGKRGRPAKCAQRLS